MSLRKTLCLFGQALILAGLIFSIPNLSEAGKKSTGKVQPTRCSSIIPPSFQGINYLSPMRVSIKVAWGSFDCGRTDGSLFPIFKVFKMDGSLAGGPYPDKGVLVFRDTVFIEGLNPGESYKVKFFDGIEMFNYFVGTSPNYTGNSQIITMPAQIPDVEFPQIVQMNLNVSYLGVNAYFTATDDIGLAAYRIYRDGILVYEQRPYVRYWMNTDGSWGNSYEGKVDSTWDQHFMAIDGTSHLVTVEVEDSSGNISSMSRTYQ
jgi:hypothetical protein